MSRWINIDDLPTSRVEWDDIFDAPSIDIVRCKECKYYKDEWCYWRDVEIRADDFCSYGERDKDTNVLNKTADGKE